MRRSSFNAVRLFGVGMALVVPLSLSAPALAVSEASSGAQTTLISTSFAGDIQMVRYDEKPAEASIATSLRQFNESAETVYLANPHATNSLGVLASAPKSDRPGPVLFTEESGEISERALLEVARLGPKSVVVVGEDVKEEAGTAARDIAQASRNNKPDKSGQVELLTWKAQTPEEVSSIIAKGVFPNGAKRVYVISFEAENVQALAAIAGSLGDGPVIITSEAHEDLSRATIEELAPEYVVGLGKIDPKLVKRIAGIARKSSFSGSIKSIALNAASTMEAKKNAVTVVASQDDPASLILAAESANGPLIPLPATTREIEAITTVLAANKMASASPKRFVVFGSKGSGGKLFSTDKK